MWALFLLLISGVAYVEQVDSSACEAVIKNYDKAPSVVTILDLRRTVITVEVNGHLREMLGKPDLKFITLQSICADIDHIGISAEDFVARSRKQQRMMAKELQQGGNREQQQAVEFAPQSRAHQGEQPPAHPQIPPPSAKHGESIPVMNAVCEVLSPMAILRSDKVGEFMGLMKSGLTLEATQCCVACSVSSGTKILVTDAGWQTHTVRVLDGPSSGCIGDLSGKVIGNCQWP